MLLNRKPHEAFLRRQIFKELGINIVVSRHFLDFLRHLRLLHPVPHPLLRCSIGVLPVAEEPQEPVVLELRDLVGHGDVERIRCSVDSSIAPAQVGQLPAHGVNLAVQGRRDARDHEQQGHVVVLGHLVDVGGLVEPAVAPQPDEVALAERGAGRALELDDGDLREQRPDRVQHLAGAVVARGVGATNEEQVGALRLDGEAHLGLDDEARRRALLDEVGEREVPEVEDDLHGRHSTHLPRIVVLIFANRQDRFEVPQSDLCCQRIGDPVSDSVRGDYSTGVLCLAFPPLPGKHRTRTSSTRGRPASGSPRGPRGRAA